MPKTGSGTGSASNAGIEGKSDTGDGFGPRPGVIIRVRGIEPEAFAAVDEDGA